MFHLINICCVSRGRQTFAQIKTETLYRFETEGDLLIHLPRILCVQSLAICSACMILQEKNMNQIEIEYSEIFVAFFSSFVCNWYGGNTKTQLWRAIFDFFPQKNRKK